MRSVTQSLIIPALSLAVSCAQLGGTEGGSANLPTRGVTGYEPVSLGSPPSSVVLSPSDGSMEYGDPQALHSDSGVVLIFTVRDLTTGHSWIARSHSANGTEGFGEPVAILGGPSSLTSYQSPSLACDEEGCLLIVAATDGSRLFVASGEVSGPFDLEQAQTIEVSEDYELGTVANPTIAWDPNQAVFRLIYEVRSAAEEQPELASATLSRGGAVEKHGLLELARPPCVSQTGEDVPCWDSLGRTHPELKRASSATGRVFWRLLYTGIGQDDTAIGFAASWSPESFEPFASNPGFTGQRSQGTNIRLDASYLLYFVSTSPWGPSGISLAQTSEGYPADTF